MNHTELASIREMSDAPTIIITVLLMLVVILSSIFDTREYTTY